MLKVILEAIDLDALLPRQVFRGTWNAFFFLPSDTLFAPRFLDLMRTLLTHEGAPSCCLANLSLYVENASQDGASAVMHLDQSVSSVEYMNLLKGQGPATGWLYGMDRYGCASSAGKWCIYCEKENDIAILALRDAAFTQECRAELTQYNVTTVEVIAATVSATELMFPFNKLTDEWKQTLFDQYRRNKAGAKPE